VLHDASSRAREAGALARRHRRQQFDELGDDLVGVLLGESSSVGGEGDEDAAPVNGGCGPGDEAAPLGPIDQPSTRCRCP
jgi:hypothetical protein